MKQLEANLNPDIFLRVHRSSIVNANCITGAQNCHNGEYLLAGLARTGQRSDFLPIETSQFFLAQGKKLLAFFPRQA